MFQRPYRSVARRVFLLSGSILIESNERSRYKGRMRASCNPRLLGLATAYWCSVAVQMRTRASCYPRLLKFLSGTGGSPGLSACQLLSRVQKARKNRDEFINYTVRVMFRPVWNLSPDLWIFMLSVYCCLQILPAF